MNKDSYHEIINGPDTFIDIADYLKNGNACLIGWTDQKGTHLDVLINLGSIKHGQCQRGIRGNELFISVMGWGSFGFDVNHNQTMSQYVAEKLGFNSPMETTDKLAELINGIKKELLNG